MQFVGNLIKKTKSNTSHNVTMTSEWSEYSDQGASCFSSQNYIDALGHYSRALEKLSNTDDSPDNSERKKEHQILLSNVIACRLKIGGEDMIDMALREANEVRYACFQSFLCFSGNHYHCFIFLSKCIKINPSWAKGHIRLAAAYIAKGGHSNDACQALQRAISLDKDNKVAREMLVKELRQRDNSAANRSGDGASSATNESQHHTAGSGSAPSAPSAESIPNNYSASDTPPINVDIDDFPAPNAPHTLSEQLQQYLTRAISWYHSQSEDKKTLFKVSFCFLLLYIALGGRFGFEYAVGQKTRGNYGSGNVYDRFRQEKREHYSVHREEPYSSRRETANENNQQSSHTSDGAYNDRSNPRNDQYYDQYRQSSSKREETTNDYDHQSSETNSRNNGGMYNDRSNPRNDQYYNEYRQGYPGRQSSNSYDGNRRTATGGSRSYNGRSSSNNNRHYSSYNDYDDYYERPPPRRSSNSFGFVS